MTLTQEVGLRPEEVFLARSPSCEYDARLDFEAPEFEDDVPKTTTLFAVRNLLSQAGLDKARFGAADWNPLAAIIQRGSRVLLKPNWVHHRNRSGLGLTCLVTHSAVIEAVLRYVLKARPASVVVGDAPIQGCDFRRLAHDAGFERLGHVSTGRSPEVTIRDLRCVHLPRSTAPQVPNPGRDADCYVLVDLGSESLLEPITHERSEFRVTMYDPRDMRRNHQRGRHRYLIAREVLDADVVINLPKLKTHKKVGITGALKNMVGINGHKEFLPHHRKGGSAQGGDCYSGSSRLKRIAEELLDISNQSKSTHLRFLLPRLGKLAIMVETLIGGDDNLTGSWYGNDTVWRTCLDLQRILYYGRADGSLSDVPQRTVLSITDGIIAGEGDGPLAPSPVEFGLLSMGTNTAALEWVHGLLMGFDPEKIPLLRQAFRVSPWPLTHLRPGELVIRLDGSRCRAEHLFRQAGRAFQPPRGWIGKCEQQTDRTKECAAQ